MTTANCKATGGSAAVPADGARSAAMASWAALLATAPITGPSSVVSDSYYFDVLLEDTINDVEWIFQ